MALQKCQPSPRWPVKRICAKFAEGLHISGSKTKMENCFSTIEPNLRASSQMDHLLGFKERHLIPREGSKCEVCLT